MCPPAPSAIADRIVVQTAVGGSLDTLLARQRSGIDGQLEIPMLETTVRFTLGDHLAGMPYLSPLDGGGYARHLSPDRRPYRTCDGQVCVMVHTDKQWNSLLHAIGRASLFADSRFASFARRSQHMDHVYGELARVFEKQATADWIRLLEQTDVPVMPMHDLESVIDDPHLRATGFFSEEKRPSQGSVRAFRSLMTRQRLQPAIGRAAPRLGVPKREVLTEAGFSNTHIDRILTNGAAKQADQPAPAPC